MIYHCGPVVRKDGERHWRFVAAGPTTSIREEPYQATVIGEYGVRGVIGKGGMGTRPWPPASKTAPSTSTPSAGLRSLLAAAR